MRYIISFDNEERLDSGSPDTLESVQWDVAELLRLQHYNLIWIIELEDEDE